MRMEVERYRILIIPENEQDKAYIEDTLFLKNKGDEIVCKRANAMNSSCIAHLEIKGGEKR